MTTAVAPDRSPLTATERMKLVDCELNIERGLSTFITVGASLALVRDQRLYRADYATFEDYCQDRWGWSRQRSAQLISAAEVVHEVSTKVDNAPLNERQARELVRVPEGERAQVWQKVIESAETLPNGDPVITAELVKRVVDKHLEPPEPKPVRSRAATPSPFTTPRPKRPKVVRETEELPEEPARASVIDEPPASDEDSNESYKAPEVGTWEPSEEACPDAEMPGTSGDVTAPSSDFPDWLISVDAATRAVVATVDSARRAALDGAAPAWVAGELRELRDRAAMLSDRLQRELTA